MASKTYVVKKNGEELEKVRGLSKAKEIAYKSGAEVFDGDKCIYRSNVRDDVSPADVKETEGVSGGTADDRDDDSPTISENTASVADQTGADENMDEAEKEKPDVSSLTQEPISEDKNTTDIKTKGRSRDAITRYRLKALMNVREKPSKDSRIIGIKAAGTIVNVKTIENDWLCLSNGTYILYENGRFAEKEQ